MASKKKSNTGEDVEDTERDESAAIFTPDPLPAESEVTVDEYCRDRSVTDRRPELIYAFAQDERRAAIVKDTPANFALRFSAFCSRPV